LVACLPGKAEVADAIAHHVQQAPRPEVVASTQHLCGPKWQAVGVLKEKKKGLVGGNTSDFGKELRDLDLLPWVIGLRKLPIVMSRVRSQSALKTLTVRLAASCAIVGASSRFGQPVCLHARSNGKPHSHWFSFSCAHHSSHVEVKKTQVPTPRRTCKGGQKTKKCSTIGRCQLREKFDWQEASKFDCWLGRTILFLLSLANLHKTIFTSLWVEPAEGEN